MSTEQHKAIVRRSIDALGRGDLAGFLADAADDLTFQIMWAPFPPVHGKHKVVKMLENTIGKRIEGSAIVMTIENLIAEGECVAEQSRGKSKTTDGKAYDNVYCRMWRIVDGKVQSLQEYLDTELAQMLVS
jgi:uncharacterized protein